MFTLLALVAIFWLIIKYALFQRLLIYLLPVLLKWWLGRQMKRAAASNHARNGFAETSLKSAMTTGEACEILNISEDANIAEITNAHRSLLKKLHPDTGGSAYLTRQLNEARDVLLHAKKGHA